ncbi:MAG: SGNH/GDSL hydrolase family protein [Myxococcota bacterium]|nr:SGNH/GDSL hydrolase family protein [Myxococcota bacterium]
MSRGVAPGRAFVFSGIVTVLAWLFAEGLLALTGTPSGPVYTWKPGIRWAMEPGLEGAAMLHLESGSRFRVTTNAEGVRTSLPSTPAGDGMETVLWLGDSTIFGWGLDDGLDPPAALQRHLRTLLPPDEIRVINGGAPGYSSLQSFMFLRQVGLAFAPSLVVLEFSLHDFRSSEQRDSRALDASGTSRTSYFLAGHSRVYRELRRVLLAARGPVEGLGNGLTQSSWGQPDPRAELVRVPPDDFRSLLEAAGEIGRASGFRLVLTFPPKYHRSIPQVYLDVAEELMAQGDLVYLDYTDAFMRSGGSLPEVYLPTDPGHYSGQGSDLVGHVLARALVQAELIGQ